VTKKIKTVAATRRDLVTIRERLNGIYDATNDHGHDAWWTTQPRGQMARRAIKEAVLELQVAELALSILSNTVQDKEKTSDDKSMEGTIDD